ncbi:hypothetical protein KR018_006131 [Drosophila ironensis]|nr:hypothetical protein KR018_006131 [Drosophila ironensis]
MLDLENVVIAFLLGTVSYFVIQLERPSGFWAHLTAAYPIVMGILAAGLIHANVCF